MKKIIFILLFFIPSISLADNIDILLECDATPTFKGDMVNPYSYQTIMKNYSGTITQQEWNDCELAANKKFARAKKKDEIKEHGISLAQAYYSSISNFEQLKLYRDIVLNTGSAYRDPQAGISAVGSIWVAGSNAFTTLDNYTGLASINDFDAVNDVMWP